MRALSALHRQEVCCLGRGQFGRPKHHLTHRPCRPQRLKRHCLGFPNGPGFRQDLDTMLDMANSLRHDPEKPVFHVMPRHGWVRSHSAALHKLQYRHTASLLTLTAGSSATEVWYSADKRPERTCILWRQIPCVSVLLHDAAGLLRTLLSLFDH